MIYALLLEENKLFVGETMVGRSVEAMYVLHCVYLESWMKQYHPIEIYWKGYGDLDQYVLVFMDIYGIDQVRGGKYVDLEVNVREIQQEIRIMKQRGCGKSCFS